jgi:thymidylate synthase ThyX
MKVTQVAIRPTEASLEANRPSLTPELLAASGARYSRNNEGLDSILSKIDPENLERSVDSIFRMIDYGHQSIGDMAPVAIFIDGISIWLAYHVWSLCPTAGGQESSTRYIKLSADELMPPEILGIADNASWQELMAGSFQAYHKSLAFWEAIASQEENVARIPQSLRNDPSEKAQRQVARMKRNYAFDRARYFLPAAATTNVMLIMSARGWVNLCQNLLSHLLPEPQRLGYAIRQELELSTPRFVKHVNRTTSIESGSRLIFERTAITAKAAISTFLAPDNAICDAPVNAFMDVHLPIGVSNKDLQSDLMFHDNRYAWVGDNLKRTMIRFGWQAVAFAEIRDFNRHRTGNKYCPLIPQGFYGALDQLNDRSPNGAHSDIKTLCESGRRASALAHSHLVNKDPAYVYWSLLGTQYPFEHLTTADKFIYEAELRTGVGAHFRYARHIRDVLQIWYAQFPETHGHILEGSAEPE